MPWVPAPSRPCSRPCPLSRLDQDIGAAKCQYTGCAALHTLHRIIRTLSTVYYLAHQPRTQYGVLLSTLTTTRSTECYSVR